MDKRKKIDFATAPTRVGAGYPPPFDAPCLERKRWRLGVAAGLTQFGVNRLRLAPGVWSSQRHWHSRDDEFVYVLEGEVVLVTDAGEETLRAGDSAGFKAGDPDGHHLQNRSDREAVVLEVGTNAPGEDVCEYPDIDLRARSAGYEHKDGTPYDAKPRR
jgi:uncharacterized cupin superfamily protein